MATEDEKKRAGTIEAEPGVTLPGSHGVPVSLSADALHSMGKVFVPGLNQNATLQGDEPIIDPGRGLIAPQNLVIEAQQRQHPIITGLGQLVEGLTTPENLTILAGTYGIGELPAGVRAALSTYFAAQAVKGANDYGGQGWQAYKRGDRKEAQRLWTLAAGNAVVGGMAGAHGAREAGFAPKVGPEPLLPKGTVSKPLARDEAVARGDRAAQVNAQAQTGLENLDSAARQEFLRRGIARAKQVMLDVDANASARRGMGNLAEAERGIEAERQARINAPVAVRKTYQGEPPILAGRPQSPERNPLEVEAAQIREQQAERQRPDFTVRDLRRVVPEDRSQPPYYEIAPVEKVASSRVVEPAPAGETVGAGGRSKAMTELAARVLADRENSLVSKFGPDVLDEARQELQAAGSMASSFERPGRYFNPVMQDGALFIKEDPKRGIRHGGNWYGVTSSRSMIEDMHPWYAGVEEGPETLGRIVAAGKGAVYNRILDRVATHIQNERESARPIVEEFGPQLRSLSGQIRDTDPELAQTMLDLAEGRTRGYRNLREYVEGKVSDAQRAAEFSRAIDEAAAEARESAGAEEAPGAGGQVRERESASARELDFEPLPESQPIHPQEIEDMSRLLGRRVTAEDIPEIRRRLDAERNIDAGLRGNRGDVAGEIREAHRTQLERQQQPGRAAAPDYEGAGKKLGIEFRGVMGADAGLGDRAVVTYQDPVSRGSIGIRVGEWSPETVERKLTAKREELSGTGERYSGFSPRYLTESSQLLQRVWDERVAKPFIDRVAKIGDKYVAARDADPAVAEGLHLLDNAPQYLRAKAAQEIHGVIGNLSRAQERLFALMADADSRENLRANHPDEYRQAQRDTAIQDALKKYRPVEQEITKLRQGMGGQVLDRDYLRRVYDKYVSGVNKAQAPSEIERGTSAFDRVIRPQRTDKHTRESTAEYHYQNGLHEFGPAFATKFIGTHLRALRDSVAKEFIDKATMVPAGGSEPRFILYNGERYYRPDVAREMAGSGIKGVQVYDRYDPTAGERFPMPVDGKYLGPRELVKTLNDFGRREESEPGSLRRFFQEQILGFGFGVPHVFNIMRRVSQTVPGGAANPQGWVRSWNVVLSKELRSRGISGLEDPTFDKLAQRGSIPTSEMSNLREYWGGNLNPANWARKMAAVGHKSLFEPGSFGGFGGLDQRARLYIADLVKFERPELSDSQIAAAVRTQLGDYNRANWSDRQKLLAKFMMFPGWDASSIRWVLQHPIKTSVPPALVVLLANQALHHRTEDQNDISSIHVGDRSYGTGLLRESFARNLFRPALAYAQAKIRGENDQRAMSEAARGVTSGAGGLLGMMRPDLSGFVALAANRQSLFSSKEIVSRDDYAQPGKILPSRAIEKEAVFALRKAMPALDRMLDSNEDIDVPAFAGGNLGVPNYRDDAEKRLYRNVSEAEEVKRTIGKLAKTDPARARQYVKDPDNAAYALFSNDLSGLAATLKRMDEAKDRIESSGLAAEDKKARTATIDKQRENLLRHADGLNNLLFERRQQKKSSAPGLVLRPGFMEDAMRAMSGQR
jgi:hypothetical protein